MDRIEKATACFSEGFSCSQSVLVAFAKEHDLSQELALRVAGAFGGGMGRSGQTCGAVTGALMALGLKHGKVRADDAAAGDKCYELAGKFLQRFKEQNGGLSCPELLGRDISNPEERTLAQQEQRFSTICPRLVRNAAEILEDVLNEA